MRTTLRSGLLGRRSLMAMRRKSSLQPRSWTSSMRTWETPRRSGSDARRRRRMPVVLGGRGDEMR